MKIVILLTILLFCLSACVPMSGVFNYPSGFDGKSKSMSRTTPPFSFFRKLDDGDYFITTNPTANSIVINIRLTKKIALKFQSGIAKLSNNGTKYTSYTFEDILLSQPLKFDCTPTKPTGCNTVYRYSAELKLGCNSKVNIPQGVGDKIWVLAPSIIYNGKLIEMKEVMFERKEISWMTPLL